MRLVWEVIRTMLGWEDWEVEWQIARIKRVIAILGVVAFCVVGLVVAVVLIDGPQHHQTFEVCRIFFFVLVVVFAHKLAKESGEKHGRARALLICAAWCVGIAFVAFGQAPGCDESNPDVCGQLIDKQLADALVFWSLLLGTPALIGVLESRQGARNPWSKPEEHKSVTT
jgi:hypothetical protein